MTRQSLRYRYLPGLLEYALAAQVRRERRYEFLRQHPRWEPVVYYLSGFVLRHPIVGRFVRFCFPII